jgi:hypothetical protein
VDPDIPYHYDPGKNIVYARAAVQWFPLIPQYNPYYNLGEYYEYQVLFPYTAAFFHKLSGFSLVEITKWLAILGGAVLSLTVYYLSLEIFNSRISALISAFLIAVSKIQLMGYMNYYPQIMALSLMPVACIFLIRYMKYEKFKYLILASLLSSLIVLASYLTALVYFLIAFLSIGIYSIWKKKSLKPLVSLPLMTGLLLAFFWLPMVWRHGLVRVIDTALRRIYGSSAGFTNQPWNLMDLLAFSNVAFIAILSGIITLFFMRKIRWDFERLLLAVWSAVAFILIESYLFRPVLWVDRYYQFFDIALILFAGIFLSLLIDRLNSIKKITFKYKGYLLLLLLIYPLYGAVNVDFVFGRWGYPSDMQMLEYMENLSPESLVAAPPGINGFWVPALSGVRILGGESSQMIEHRYLGDGESNQIINSPDADSKMEIIRKYGVNYIYIPVHEHVNMVWNPYLEKDGIEAFNNASYFEVIKIFKDVYGYTALIKVRENLKPNFNIEKIDWAATIAGYLISILSLTIAVYIYKYRN